MPNPKNKHVLTFNAVHDHVIPDSETAAFKTKIFFARAPQIGETRKQNNALNKGVY